MSSLIKQNEKRKTKRNPADSMIMYIQEKTNCYFSGDICNLSHYGLCFKTGYFVKPGSIIKIKTDEYLENTSYANHINDRHAVVKWCANFPGFSAFLYRVGVELLEK